MSQVPELFTQHAKCYHVINVFLANELIIKVFLTMYGCKAELV